MIRTFVSFGCAVVVFLKTAQALALNFSSVGALPEFATLREASRLVVSLEISGKGPIGTGAGFILSTDPANRTAWIVTAAHCIFCKDLGERNCSIVARGIFGSARGRFRSLRMDPIQDIALIQVELPKKFNIAIRAPFGDASKALEGEQAMWFGNPDLRLRPDRQWVLPRPRDFRKRGIRFTDGRVHAYSPRFPVALSPTRVVYVPNLLMFGDSLPGNSGGPVFNSRGEILGIVIKTLGDALCTGITPSCYQLAAPSNAILPFIASSIGSL